jgi:hypothetical protein
MHRRRTPGFITTGVLGVALCLGGAGLGFVASSGATPAAWTVVVAPHAAHRMPGTSEAEGSASSDSVLVPAGLPIGRRAGPSERGAHRDARAYLFDAASAARKRGPWRDGTRTEHWLNAPATVGSTSPPAGATAIDRFPGAG